MPTFDKSKKKWRGVVKYEGKRHQRLFDTKKAAKGWEVEKKQELEKKETQPTMTCHCGKSLMSIWTIQSCITVPKSTKKKRACLINS